MTHHPMNDPNAKTMTYAEKNVRLTGETCDGFAKERYAQFAKHLPTTPKRVLDVGANDGSGGTVLKQCRPGIELHGLDCVQEWLDKLPPAYAGGIQAMTMDIPVADCHFSAIVAGEFLEHLYPKDVDSTLAEFQRILEIGGRLLMTTPNPNSLKMRLKGRTVFGRSHLTQHHPDALRMRLRMHGFSRIRFYGSGKATRKLGEYFPWLSIYGSYLVTADKW
jgi:cyclopropane fatty-acyl-phospholipid synthase-like methyltransferase